MSTILDRHRRVVDARLEALIGVEGQPAELLEQHRIPGAQRKHGRKHEERKRADQEPPHELCQPGSAGSLERNLTGMRPVCTVRFAVGR
jgi:hypothetical protein